MRDQNKLNELLEEFRLVLAGRRNLLDSVLPPLVFLIINAFLGLTVAFWTALALAAAITVLRLVQGQPLGYALGGLAGVAAAVLFAWLLGRAEGFYLTGIFSSAATTLICALSLIVRRPLVAWTSHLARRWPRAWYWHPRVRPAYGEVTGVWLAYFVARLALQLYLFQQGQAAALGVASLLLGWPATVVLLVFSYLYGTWRLRNLGGPSVEEFKDGSPPPWAGQTRGF